MQGESPVGIFGPGGHTLLFARFSQAGGGGGRPGAKRPKRQRLPCSSGQQGAAVAGAVISREDACRFWTCSAARVARSYFS